MEFLRFGDKPKREWLIRKLLNFEDQEKLKRSKQTDRTELCNSRNEGQFRFKESRFRIKRVDLN